MLVPVTHIPRDVGVIAVSDMFVEDYVGGAELTLEAILDACPQKVMKIRSAQLTLEAIESGKDKVWVVGNFASLPRDCIIGLATSGAPYYVIECDYKYCQFRSSHLHKLQTGKECDCTETEHTKIMYGFFKRAKKVFFMSQGQLNEYKRVWPQLNKEQWQDRCVVQGSTFKPETLDFLFDLLHKTKTRIDKWVVLGGGSWIKNQQDTERYCKSNNMPYDVVGGLPHKEFLRKIAGYKGLVFHPKGFDTNPRVTIEAKVLGLELDLNENVQQKDDEWFRQEHPHDILNYLRKLPNQFWEHVALKD